MSGPNLASAFTRNQFAWLDQVAADPELEPVAFKAAWYISRCVNRNSVSTDRPLGEAFPAQSTIASAIGSTLRTVSRVIESLKGRGHLKVITGRGRHQACRYEPILKFSAGAKNTSEMAQHRDENAPPLALDPLW